ncbi:MAG: hypothetical protein L0154_23370 [Chloroflexi bacterium]|nr:hypothetical protein [Chloroflexota bacterium]
MRRFFNILTSATFVALLIVPLAEMVTSPVDAISETEQRTLAQQPAFENSVTDFIEQSEAFLNDQFGYREVLIHWNNLLRVRFFARSPVQDVIIGKDGWLFLNTDNLMDDHRGIIGLPETGILQLTTYFEYRNTWLAQRDVAYLVVFVPDKQSIYSEYLPSVYRDVVKSNNTRLDLFMETQPAVNILDLRPILLEAKGETLLYARYDTHWNQRGAYLAYIAIIDRLTVDFPILSPLSEPGLRPGEFERSGDLARLMSLEDQMIETLPRLAVPRRDRCAEQIEENVTRCAGRPLRVLMFHDSFGEALKHFMSETFGEIMYVQGRFDPVQHQALIDRFQPDLVIDEIVERWLSSYDGRVGE